jgi:hypothetical protein
VEEGYYMRLKISTTGKPAETKIVDAESGAEVVGVKHVEVSIDPFEILAVLVLNDFEADLTVDKVEVVSESTLQHDGTAGS